MCPISEKEAAVMMRGQKYEVAVMRLPKISMEMWPDVWMQAVS